LKVELGGLDMPNIIIYYNRACHARLIWELHRSYCDLCPNVDSWACSPFSIWSLFACLYKHVDTVRKNVILYNSVKVWRQISRFSGKGEMLFMLSPIYLYQDFVLGMDCSG